MSEKTNGGVEQDDEAGERRSEADSQRRDRRVIPRLGDADLRKFMKFSARLCQLAVIFSVIYIAGLMSSHVWGLKRELNRLIFFSVVVAILAFGVHQLGRAIRSYVENESKARLVIVSERLFQTLLLVVCTGAILGAVHLITLF